MELKALIISVLLVFTFSGVANSQTAKELREDTSCTYKIDLIESVNNDSFGNLLELQVAKNYSFLKNIPNIENDLYAINYFNINNYARLDSLSNQIFLFVAINNKKKEKYVVIDANNNRDLSDDQVLTFKTYEQPLTREEIEKRSVRLKIRVDSLNNNIANIVVDPYNYFSYKYGLSQDERLEVVIGFIDYMTASTQIGNTPIEIDAQSGVNLNNRKLNNKTDFIIRFKKNNEEWDYRTFVLGDTFNIRNDRLILSDIKHPSIYLKYIGQSIDSSTIGSIVPSVFARDLNTKNIKINDQIQSKYVFIDFWGSWCGPCIKSIPKLKNLYEKVRNKQNVLMLGVAQEADKKDVDKLKEVINKNGIEWTNMWISREESEKTTSIIKKLDIKAFPTYLIIDNNGRIVYKESSIYKTDEAISFFLNLIE